MIAILPDPDDAFVWVAAPWEGAVASHASRYVLQCRPLAAIAAHFFTTRDLQLRGDSPRAEADWARVAAGIGVPLARLQRMHQVHGCATSVIRFDVRSNTATSPSDIASPGHVASAGHGAPPSRAAALDAAAPIDPEADALVTAERDVALVVRVADCVPLLIADPRTGAVAAVHAGWRGTAAGVAAATVQRLRQEYGCDPPDLVAALGPSIGACCYQVGADVRTAFIQAGRAPASIDAWFTPDGSIAGGAALARTSEPPRWRLDTWAANRDQLIAAGLRAEHVHVARLCTKTHRTLFYSYRAEGASTGRLLGVIRRSA